MTRKAGWQSPFAAGQTWTAHDGAQRLIVTLFAGDDVSGASIRYSDGVTDRTRTIAVVAMRSWVASKGAVLA